jgi:hypothetical protein
MNSKEVIQEIRHLLFGEEEKSVEMATATLVDGTIIEWNGELAVGTAIFVQTGEGLIPAPDATHEVEGGMLVTTEGGVVTEIVEVEVEVVEEEAKEEEMAKEEFATLEAFNSFVSRFEEAVERLAVIEEKMSHNEASFNSMKEAFGKTVDLVEKVADLPSEEPTKAPAKLSKKEERFNNIINIAKQLKK